MTSDQPPALSDPNLSPGYPVFAQPLDYAKPPPRRPGLVTAIGVISIIVASFSILSGGAGVLGMVVFYAVRGTMAPAPAVTSVTRSTGANGLQPAQRQVVVQALTAQTPLSSGQLEQLDAILGENGQQIFPSLSANPSVGAIADRLEEHSAVPNSAPGGMRGDQFVFSSGRLNLYEDRAAFTPTGSGQAIAVQVEQAATTSEVTISVGPGPSVAPTSPTTLPASDVQAIIARAQTLSSNRLNPAQVRALQSLLQSPNQQLVSPSSPGVPTSSQLTMATVDSDGKASLLFRDGMIVLSPQGQLVSQMNTKALAAGTRFLGVVASRLALLLVEYFLSLALAIYLLVVGILTLRHSRRGRKLHYIYVFLKIPLAIVAGTAWVWFASGFMSVRPTPRMSSGDLTWAYAFQAAMMTIPACIYPIALLFVLRTRRIRAYYSPQQSAV